MELKKPNRRIVGLDLARAMAIFGMIIVNYKLAMGAQDAGPNWLRAGTENFEGRASALFVILAGIGISLMTARARASGDELQLKASRKTLFRRAAFLFFSGIALLGIGWSPDILHYYAVFIALSAFLLQTSDKKLFAWIIFILITTIFHLFFLDYSYGWSADYHEYVELWTWSGFVRNLLFNGFHPIFPCIAALTEFCSRWAIREFTPEFGSEVTQALLSSKPMPPNLIYVFAAAATALAVLVLCIQVAERWKELKWVQALISTGQLSLTHYAAHVVIGLVPLQLLGLSENASVVFSTIYAFLFYVTAIAISFCWKKRHGRGPLELLVRKWG